MLERICGGKGAFPHCWWGCRVGQPLWKRYGGSTENTRFTMWPCSPTPGIYLEKLEFKKTHAPPCSWQHYLIAKTWRAPSVHQQVNEEDVVGICGGILLSHKRMDDVIVATALPQLEPDQTKRSKSERERQNTIWCRSDAESKIWRNDPICETETESQADSSLLLPRGEAWGGCSGGWAQQAWAFIQDG